MEELSVSVAGYKSVRNPISLNTFSLIFGKQINNQPLIFGPTHKRLQEFQKLSRNHPALDPQIFISLLISYVYWHSGWILTQISIGTAKNYNSRQETIHQLFLS